VLSGAVARRGHPHWNAVVRGEEKQGTARRTSGAVAESLGGMTQVSVSGSGGNAAAPRAGLWPPAWPSYARPAGILHAPLFEPPPQPQLLQQ